MIWEGELFALWTVGDVLTFEGLDGISYSSFR
jgi:hypothetical protein